MQDFNNKVAVITGAASGIGRGLAQYARSQGMRVVLADLNQAALDALAAELGAEHCLAVATDVSNAEAVQALADRSFAHFGQVDLLFNNAGVLHMGSICDTALSRWRQVLDIDLMGVLYGIHAFVPRMQAQGTPCHVVNTSSMAGLLPAPMMGVYTVAKFGVLALTETLQYEMADTQVGVSVLCPGPVATQVGNNASTAEGASGFGQAIQNSVNSGMPPIQVAELVFNSIRNKDYWIFTHPEVRSVVAARLDTMFSPGVPVYTPYKL